MSLGRHEYERYLAWSTSTTRGVLSCGIPENIYRMRAALQADLDGWMEAYNQPRPHQRRWCYGKTPMQMFLDSVALAKEKISAA